MSKPDAILVAVIASALTACAAPEYEPSYSRILMPPDDSTLPPPPTAAAAEVEVPPAPEVPPFPTPRVVVVRQSDDRIEAGVNRALELAPDVDPAAIEVAVDEGTVTLSGAVRSLEEAERARAITMGVPGVEDVLLENLTIE